MTLSKKEFPNILGKLDIIATENGYSKIFAKITSCAREKFIENGYIIEASMPRFNNGQESIYFSIMRNNRIVALSSSEMDNNLQNAEMTDFATLPEYQGKGLAQYLLYKMEDEMRRRNVQLVYTISRAMSYEINILFAKMGYSYGGTLWNNTNISIETVSNNNESMNVWYKDIK